MKSLTQTMQMDFKGMMLSEISQKEKDKYYMSSPYVESKRKNKKKRKTLRYR